MKTTTRTIEIPEVAIEPLARVASHACPGNPTVGCLLGVIATRLAERLDGDFAQRSAVYDFLREINVFCEDEDAAVQCHFCDRRAATVEAAVEAGWVPSFYGAGDEYETPEPVCPECQAEHLELIDGELVQVTD